jgi:hypothetical protein
MKSLPLVFSLALLAAPAGAQQNPPLSGPAVGPSPFNFGLSSTSDLTPPDAAAQIGGSTGSPWGWLNVANGPLTLNDALTGVPIEDGAWANAHVDVVIEVKFAGGVTNGPGDDMAMVDAQFDVGVYSISSSYDGFAASLTVDTATGDICTTVDYYYEHNAGGPFGANVVAKRFDLSDLGVPAGTTVTNFRIAMLNASCDPVTLAKIDSSGSGFHLDVSALVAGQPGTFTLTGATANGRVGLAYSLFGPGPTSVNTGVCGFMSVDLSAPVKVLAIAAADANGKYALTRNIPAGASGRRLWVQGLDFGTCALSNLVATTIN